MKALFLSTSSGETTKYAESLTLILGAEPGIVRYDTPEATDHGVYKEVAAAQPDMIVYIGSRWGKQPATATLARINGDIAPMVHLCSDAADPPWHDLLREYANSGAFALQVAIDGNDAWPGADRGMTLLTPIAAEHFAPVMVPHAERPIACGYAGNPGNPQGRRRTVLTELLLHNLLTVRMRADVPGSYDEMCRFLSSARLSLNVPFTGTEATTHVKGRVLETGLAGGMLLEGAGSPTRRWFQTGVDYFEYESIGAATVLIQHYAKHPEESEKIGANLRKRVLEEHSPAVFWKKIMTRIGL